MSNDPRVIKRTNFFVKGFNALVTFDEWRRQGFPGRAPEDVEAIFNEHCSKCPLYNPDGRSIFGSLTPKGLCDDGREVDGIHGCGCHVSSHASEWSNALAMAVKPCPLDKFPHLVKESDE